MGDRATIVVRKKNEGVGLYTHWCGSEALDVLRASLKFAIGENRENDEAYLARIIFCRLVEGDPMGATGFGIMPGDAGDGRTVYVNVDSQTVESPRSHGFGIPLTAITDFITSGEENWDADNEGDTDEGDGL